MITLSELKSIDDINREIGRLEFRRNIIRRKVKIDQLKVGYTFKNNQVKGKLGAITRKINYLQNLKKEKINNTWLNKYGVM
jgi:hypothetical protein